MKLSDSFSYRMLLKFTLPSVAMMIFTSIYGVVDDFFCVEFCGRRQVKAVNLIMPFLMIAATDGFMFGTGGTAIVSNTSGEGNKEKANEYFSLFLYSTFVIGVIFGVVSFIFIRSVVRRGFCYSASKRI